MNKGWTRWLSVMVAVAMIGGLVGTPLLGQVDDPIPPDLLPAISETTTADPGLGAPTTLATVRHGGRGGRAPALHQPD